MAEVEIASHRRKTSRAQSSQQPEPRSNIPPSNELPGRGAGREADPPNFLEKKSGKGLTPPTLLGIVKISRTPGVTAER